MNPADITRMIPPEVVEAAAKAAYELAYNITSEEDPGQWHDASQFHRDYFHEEARAAIAAAFAAWKGAQRNSFPIYNGLMWSGQQDSLILPLPQKENSDV
jgi:hypothetical protein